MIQRGKSHRLAKVGAAQNRESVHAVSGDMDRCTDAVWQVRVALESRNGVLAGHHQGRERNSGLRRVHLVRGQVDVSQYFTGWATLGDEYVE